MTEDELVMRYRGALLGLATGDALGMPLEFQAPGSFPPLTDMVGGGPFNLHPGEWTDDTSMALCLAESLIDCQNFDVLDQMWRYVRWMDDGYNSVLGRCFDIGVTTRQALVSFKQTGNPFSGSTAPDTAGNGSIMRLAPVALFCAFQPAQAIEWAGDSSRTTHGTAASVDACRYLAALLVGALHGASKDELLAPRYSPVPNYWQQHPLHPAIDEVAAGSFKQRNPPDIQGSGYVVQSLEAALWAFYHTSDFAAGCLQAVNLGDDADTTGAVYGQLAGAFYGDAGIPEKWLDILAMRERFDYLAERLLMLAQRAA